MTATKKATAKKQPAPPKRAAKTASKTPAADGLRAGKAAPAKGEYSSRGSEKTDLASPRIAALLKGLARAYPDAECALDHRNAWELLVATILSAQCTDARVNMVTPALFRKYPAPADLASASLPEVEEAIRTTGFYRSKAKSITGAARLVTERFGGQVPRDMDELLTLPGVARKTANVVLGVAYGQAEGVVVDTHVTRLSLRLGLTRNTDARKIEEDLMRIIPRDRWIAFSHEVIHHGRRVCVARKPKCAECPIESLCRAADKTWGA